MLATDVKFGHVVSWKWCQRFINNNLPCDWINQTNIWLQSRVLRFECCEGFHRVPGQEGCAGGEVNYYQMNWFHLKTNQKNYFGKKLSFASFCFVHRRDNTTVKPLKNILETARELGATDFVRYVEESGLEKEWTRDGVWISTATKSCFLNYEMLIYAKKTNHRLSHYSLRPTKPLPICDVIYAPESTRSVATLKIRSFVITYPTGRSRPIRSRPTKLCRHSTMAIDCVSTNIRVAWVVLF